MIIKLDLTVEEVKKIQDQLDIGDDGPFNEPYSSKLLEKVRAKFNQAVRVADDY